MLWVGGMRDPYESFEVMLLLRRMDIQICGCAERGAWMKSWRMVWFSGKGGISATTSMVVDGPVATSAPAISGTIGAVPT